VKELVALARQMPGKLTFASSGNGSSVHLAGELLNTVAGIDMLHVPFKGVVQALTDVVGGRVDMMFIGVSGALPHIKAGKLRALAVASPARAQNLPGVPTMAEAGFPGFEVPSNFGILAPAGTPKGVITKLHAVLAEALQTQEMKTRFVAVGVEPVTNTPEEFALYIRSEIAKWAKVARAAKLEPL
jgi:tripartite-type tricarboxylate transporter receptor subunit TctC